MFQGEVNKVSLPTSQGRITLLPGHINLVTTLAAGELRYFVSKDQQSSLEEYTDKDNKITIAGWLAMIETDSVTIAAEE